jgi:hypothetical protein
MAPPNSSRACRSSNDARELLNPANASIHPVLTEQAGLSLTPLNGHKRARNPEPSSISRSFRFASRETENQQKQQASLRKAKPSGFAPQS